MNYAQQLVNLYSRFYRAEWRKDKHGYTANGCIKPLALGIDTIIKNPRLSTEELKMTICGQLMVLMRQIHATNAEGRWVTSGDNEIAAISAFASFLVEEVFIKALNKDISRLTGKKKAILLHTCEFMYRLESDEKREKTAINY